MKNLKFILYILTLSFCLIACSKQTPVLTDAIQEAHAQDIQLVVNNKIFSQSLSKEGLKSIIKTMRTYMNESDIQTLEENMKKNIEKSIKREWSKIDRNQIDHFEVYKCVNLSNLNRYAKFESTENALVEIVSAKNNKGKIKYINLYVYLKNSGTDKYSIDSLSSYILLQKSSDIIEDIEKGKLKMTVFKTLEI